MLIRLIAFLPKLIFALIPLETRKKIGLFWKAHPKTVKIIRTLITPTLTLVAFFGQGVSWWPWVVAIGGLIQALLALFRQEDQENWGWLPF